MEFWSYHYIWRLLGAEPSGLTYTFVFAVVAYTCCIFGVVFGKMGRSPFWGFIFLPPFFGTVALWIFGLGRWPQEAVKPPSHPWKS